MKKVITTFLLVLPVLVYSQTYTENFVKSTIFQVPVLEGNLNNLTNDDKIESVTYFDGLGRPKQSVAQRTGGNREDLMTPIEYDKFGRQSKQYLPYPNPTLTNDGAYLSSIVNPLIGYYDTRYDDVGTDPYDLNAYSESRFEQSPLNRVLEIGAPGKDWKIQPASDNDHTIKSDWNTNLTGEVKLFTVSFFGGDTTQPQLEDDGDYSSGKLYKSVIKDENWTSSDGDNRTTHEFESKSGRVILKRAFNDNLEHDTYYIYDDFGNLTYVLSPKASLEIVDASNNLISNFQPVLDDLAYQYKYDHRNRLIEKKIPGKGWEYIVYNKLDQPVFTQDALLRASDKWLFTKYDIYGRIIMTGIRGMSLTRAAAQSLVDGYPNPYETRSSSLTVINGVTTYYTNTAPPNDTLYTIHTINYYDSYSNLDTDGMTVPTVVIGIPTTQYSGVTTTTDGLPTLSKVRILDTNNWITTITGYDDKGQAVYLQSKNQYLETDDTVQSRLDFTGKPTETITTHGRTAQSDIITLDYFYYDHMGRLLSHKQKIDSEPLQLIAENHYDELGQLIEKKVGGQTYQDGYTEITNVSVTTDGSITKNISTSTWDAYVKTKGKIPASSNGGIQANLPQNNKNIKIGLLDNSSFNLNAGYFDYGIHAEYSSGLVTLKLILGSTSSTGDLGTYADDDSLKVERFGNNVLFYRGATLLHTEAVGSNASILVGKVAFQDQGGSVENLALIGNSIDKKLQEIDFDYNVRGWLTDINDVDDIGGEGSTGKLFNFRINYTDVEGASANVGIDPLFNGNIAQTIWRTDNDSDIKRSYGYSYDALNRITGTDSRKNAGLNTQDVHGLSGLSYDKNGNILGLTRSGSNDLGTGSGVWDQLTYSYSGNQLEEVVDQSPNSTYKDKGFKDDGSIGTDYSYDVNGNMTVDDNKNITGISYNHLNLPTSVTFSIGGNTGNISYVYDATGVKQAKIFSDIGANPQIMTTQYAGNYVYLKDGSDAPVLQFFNHPEGYIEPTPVIPSGGEDTKSVSGFDTGSGETTFSAYMYVFQYKDHLGNVRLSYADSDLNGSINPNSEIIEESNYFPFGLKQKGYNYDVSSNGNSLAQQWKFNGMEISTELSLEWYDFGARNYNSALGRWMNLDPLSENMRRHSPYNFAFDNPVYFIDPDGREPIPGLSSSFDGINKLTTTYVNRETKESVTVDDGIDKTVFVSSSDFQKAKFFANEINGGTSPERDQIIDDYVDFYDSVNSYKELNAKSVVDYLFNRPIIMRYAQGEPVGGEIGEWLLPEAKGGVTLLSVIVARIKFIQKHHIIPRATYKKYAKALESMMRLNGGNNLKKLPTPFHGNHPQYNKYVTGQIDNLLNNGNVNPETIRALQGNLNRMINDAYDSGMKLNDYFRQFN